MIGSLRGSVRTASEHRKILDILREFLIESAEDLSRLDHEMSGTGASNPQDHDLLAGIFRTIHTIKGAPADTTFGCQRLEAIAHIHREHPEAGSATEPGTSIRRWPGLLLAAVDAIKRILASSIEAESNRGVTSSKPGCWATSNRPGSIRDSRRRRRPLHRQGHVAPLAITPVPRSRRARTGAWLEANRSPHSTLRVDVEALGPPDESGR